MKPEKWERDYGRFSRGVLVRLRQGAEEYQGKSFDANPPALVEEVGEEIMDVAAWSFILWTRLERIRKALDGSDVKEGQSCQR